MKTIWTEGSNPYLLRYSNADRILRYVEIRRYKRDVVVQFVVHDPVSTRDAWTGYEWEAVVIPVCSWIAVDPSHTNQELIRAAIKWYETGEWSIETNDEGNE